MTPHADHSNLNDRGYFVRGCFECAVLYPMAYPSPAVSDPPDSATASMAAHAWAIVVLLVIFVLSSWVPLQPSTGPAVPAGVTEWVAR